MSSHKIAETTRFTFESLIELVDKYGGEMTEGAVAGSGIVVFRAASDQHDVHVTLQVHGPLHVDTTPTILAPLNNDAESGVTFNTYRVHREWILAYIAAL